MMNGHAMGGALVRWTAGIVAGCVAAVAPIASAQQSDLAGHWEGAIDLPQATLTIDLDFVAAGDEAWTGDITIPQQGAKDLPLQDIAFDGSRVSFIIAGIPGTPTFVGTLSESGDRIEGDFTQGPIEVTWHADRAGADTAQIKATVDDLGPWIDEARDTLGVPGCAVAIVKDGRVVLTQGFGVRDADTDEPATADTVFMIGSCTKAFTTLLVAQQVEAGTLDWDEPVRSYLPWFAMDDAWAGEHLTLRDFCSHRSGLPRHDMTWYGRPDVTRRQLVEGLAYLQESHEPRTVWQYNNLGFIVAGEVLSETTGSTWDELIKSRIFVPLGMTHSGVSIDELLAQDDHAVPHGAQGQVIDFRHVEQAGPAGSITSSASDMARWLRMLLAGGTIDSTRIIQTASLRTLGTPQMIMPGFAGQGDIIPMGYGLGWMIDSYHGHVRVQHGGGIDGFTSLVTLVPSERLGVVVLTNSASGLSGVVTDRVLRTMIEIDAKTDPLAQAVKQREIVAKVLEAAQEDTQDTNTASPARPLGDYVGRYLHPAYGTVTISLADEDGSTDRPTMRGSINTLTGELAHTTGDLFELRLDNREVGAQLGGGMKMRFVTGFNGHITAIESVLEAGVDPIRFERQADAALSDPAYLDAFVGSYEFEVAPQVVTIQRRGDTLVGQVPGQPEFALKPQSTDSFTIAELDGFSVRFERDPSGAVTHAVFDQPNGTFRAARRDDTPSDEGSAPADEQP